MPADPASLTGMTLAPLPAQPADVPWPTEAWPQGDLPRTLKRERFEGLLAEAFDSDATPLDKKDALKVWVGNVVDCFR